MRFTYDALPGRIVFGAGRRSEVGAEVERLGATRVFLISDGQAKAIADELAGTLGALVVARWDEVVQHVPVELADRARAAVADAGADLVVTVGGGSSTGLGQGDRADAAVCRSSPCRPRTREASRPPSTGSPADATSRPAATSSCSRRP